MPFQVLEEEFGRLQAEWEGLLSLCPRPSPFVHPAFQRAWADAFLGGAEGPEPLLWSVREGERLIGVASLLARDGTLALAGDPSVCDYADLVCTPGYEEAFLAELLTRARASFEGVDLWGLQEDSPTLSALDGAARRAGFDVARELEAVAPAVRLPGSWEEYLAGLSKKDRHELRRKIRRFGALGGGVRVRAVTGGPELTEGARVLRELMAMSRQDKLEFLRRPQMETFFARLVEEMGAAGLIRLYVVDLDGKPVAAVLCFLLANRLYMYNSGYDPALAQYSVGLVSKAAVIQDAIEQGYECVDFLRGDESYKYDLGATDQRIYRCVLTRR
ncbi:MAG TPA: GNAT family N-acetyltransferase [Dehalococcoidia bacterium]|nr:GNAT family N-acetyltransferase [Dehalococcoidia bacterium]